MKIEKRGKYAGVKVHLGEEECVILMQGSNLTPVKGGLDFSFSAHNLLQRLGKKISALLKVEPSLLKERTPNEIKIELLNEFESAKLKLEALDLGKDWKEIHVK